MENLADLYPDALWQRCVVHFFRNVWTAVPTGKVKAVAAMPKGHPRAGRRQAGKEKARQVVEKLREMRLAKAAEIVENGIDETLSCYAMPPEHGRSLRINNPLERLMREIRRRTRVVGAFPDGHSALMLVAAATPFKKLKRCVNGLGAPECRRPNYEQQGAANRLESELDGSLEFSGAVTCADCCDVAEGAGGQ